MPDGTKKDMYDRCPCEPGVRALPVAPRTEAGELDVRSEAEARARTPDEQAGRADRNTLAGPVVQARARFRVGSIGSKDPSRNPNPNP
eukprot:scaffold5435_cov47-Phaeocystis_antarctica.AAC.2